MVIANITGSVAPGRVAEYLPRRSVVLQGEDSRKARDVYTTLIVRNPVISRKPRKLLQVSPELL